MFGRIAVLAVTASLVTGCNQQSRIVVHLGGDGAGKVVSETLLGPNSSTVAIDCPGDCDEASVFNSEYVLTATASSGSRFTGWDGADCSGTGVCHLFTVTQPQVDVTANFERLSTQATLSVSRTGTGSGTVRSVGSSTIDCGATCAGQFSVGTLVTLEATASSGSSFAGWSGACTGSASTCTVTLDSAKSVVASFTAGSLVELSVSTIGTGSGTVRSVPSGIDCGATCSASYAPGTEVTLTATPSADSTFAGWTGVCTGTGPCVVAMTAAKTVSARFTRHQFTLTVNSAGTGAGAVTSSPSGISCGANCVGDFDEGTVVTLTAAADSSSTFAGWSGGCTGSTTCTVTVAAATTVTATFNRNAHAILVSKIGTGGGTVTSAPTGIDCGTTCAATFNAGATVVLSATPDADSVFDGWSGGCFGNGMCTVVVGAASSVTARFTRLRFTLTVAKAGNGGGTVVSTPAGLSCGSTCSTDFDTGTMVDLVATPSGTSTFMGWSGACTGTGTCTVSMTSAQTVTATFALTPFTLTVAKSGTGTGRVSSAPTGIDCGATCSASYLATTTVTLTADPDANADFDGWSGGGCSGTGTCVVTLTAATTVTAAFSKLPRTLTVSKAGTGTGLVTSSPTGVNCGATCSTSYLDGTAVSLTATADPGSIFSGWSGGGCSGTGVCALTLTAGESVSATFTRQQYTLTVNRTGTGGGTVVSAPTGISCGATCSAPYNSGTSVQLTQMANSTSVFTGWSGACTGTGACVVDMTAAKTVSATFTATNPLVVTNSTPAGGVVTSNPSGITCGSTCQAQYLPTTMVTLTATPNLGWRFLGWTGACSGTGVCSVSMSAPQLVLADFGPAPANTVFVTSITVTGNMGGLSGADAICQQRANVASIPGTFRAWLSTNTVSAISRLGTASGWKRPDGMPFANSQADLVAGKIFYPLRIDEFGFDAQSEPVFTNTSADGTKLTIADTCTDWTSTVTPPSVGWGDTSMTGVGWTIDQVGTCGSPHRLYCFGISQTAIVTVDAPPMGSRRAFVSAAKWVPSGGIATADALCASEAQAANLTGTFLALLAPAGATAASRFSTSGTPWFRVDGVQLSSTAAGFFTDAYWKAPLNVTAEGNLLESAVWSGAASLTQQGANASTCLGWTSASMQDSTSIGIAANSRVGLAFGTSTVNCDFPAARLLCLQQ